jgi:predicted transcriptional regulator
MGNVYSSETPTIQNGLLPSRPGNGDGLCQEVVRPVNRDIQRDRQRLALKMRLAGALQREIAEALGVTQQAVSRLLGRIDRFVVKRMQADVSLVRQRQALRLERLFDEAVKAWERSLQSRSRQRSCKTFPCGTGEEAVWTESSDARPDPRFLAVALHVLAAERRLWGLEFRETIKVLKTGPVLPAELVASLERAYSQSGWEAMNQLEDVSEVQGGDGEQ